MAPWVAQLMARELGTDTSWIVREVASFQELGEKYLVQ
jgi:hypothetical protein